MVWLAYLLVFYISMSVHEWAVHKYYRHSRTVGSVHLDHHSETKSDMTLRTTNEKLDADPYRGTTLHMR